MTWFAIAHNGAVHGPEPWTIATAVSLLAIAFVYALGLRNLWRKAVQPWQVLAFFLGWAFAGIALLSPLDRWSDVLFSAHMAQHEILMLISAPLMVAGRPYLAALHVVPALARTRRVWEALTGPTTVLVLHAVVLWLGHVPVLFEAALRDESVHVVQHLGFFVTAALFWFALLHGRYGRMGYGIGVLYVFATAMHTQILGALLTFGSRVWYPTHAARTAAAGVSPVDDQQLAGVLMWIPFGAVFLFVALALFAAWLGEAERRVAFTSAGRMARQKGFGE
jgi:putative membrane protein